MKILWLVNIKLPMISQAEGDNKSSNVGGWLTGLACEILKSGEQELVIVYPEADCKEHTGGQGRLHYYGVPVNQSRYSGGFLDTEQYTVRFSEIIAAEAPQAIHIHGTEFQLACAMMCAAGRQKMLRSTVVSIQGLVSIYARHFWGGAETLLRKRRTLYELLTGYTLGKNFRDFQKRGVYEIKTLEQAQNVIGRTGWDKGSIRYLSSDAAYFHCNEILRQEFYDGKWRYAACRKHSVFMSQGGAPLKGLHMLLEAVGELKRYYPDVEVRIAGKNMLTPKMLFKHSYPRYLKSIITKYGLEQNVSFLGFLDAEQMKEQYLCANVYVCASSIENSPNSLGEAMILGVPCVASNVGGIGDLLVHKEEGYLYPFDETYMLMYYLKCVFDDGEHAEAMGERAREHALKTHDRAVNCSRMMEIYREIGLQEEG